MMRFSLRKPQAKERKARESDERASKGEQKELKKDRRKETVKRENAIRARGESKEEPREAELWKPQGNVLCRLRQRPEER